MAAPLSIRSDYGLGGAGVGGTTNAVHPRIGRVLRGLIDDIAARTPATIASPDAAAQGGAYVQADVQSIATLANELKAAMNAASGATATVTKATL